MNRTRFASATATLAIVLAAAPLLAAAPAELDRYNVVWTAPSRDAGGSMPLGNGEVGLNVWVEQDGDLRFYIARTDSWSEASRLLKLGRVRLSLDPNPFAAGAPFRQELRLRQGRIDIVAGQPQVRLALLVDAHAPVIHVVGQADAAVKVRATVENWRTEKKTLTGAELASSWTMQAAPKEIEVWESADHLVSSPQAVVWYHRNEHSCVPLTLKHQGLEALAGLVGDPLLGRTFGGAMSAPGLVPQGDWALASPQPLREFAVKIVAHTAVTPTAEAWQQEVAALAAAAAPPPKAQADTAAWWDRFWDRSWVFVEGDALAAATLPVNDHPLRLGADSNGGSRFRGCFARATVFGRALDDAEIAALAAGGPAAAAAVTAGQLVGWRFTAAPPEAQVVGAVRFESDEEVPVARFAGGYLQLAASPDRPLNQCFTLEAWIRPDPQSGSARIFDKLTAGKADGFLFDTHPGRSLRFISGPQSMHVADVLALGAWNHVAAVYDGATEGRRLYLNGKLLKAEGGAAPEPTPSPVTRAYVLQRWMGACAGRGNYPIKFNGSIFTVDPELTDPKALFNADWRRWGDCFWWQNTRFPALAAIANGDFDLGSSLFALYRRVLPISQARAKLYYGAQGAYFPETMTHFGTYANRDYGWNRQGKAVGDVDCKYWRYSWQQGLELVALMLDYYDHTGDARFLEDQVLPMAREVLRYFDSRFSRDARGKLAITPTQAVETYWFDVVNDTPTVAGLNAVLDRLLLLPESPAAAADRRWWRQLKAATPPVPIRSADGRRFIAPAEQFDPKRSNCENPELYAIWPFGLFGVGRPDLEVAVETFHRRGAKIMTGWCYDGQCAALVGLTEEAQKQLLTKVRNSHRNHRFAAMWGPNFDWLPDQDHGNNILLTLQAMLLRTDGEKIVLFPAWPRAWNVRFKFHAPRQTVVEAQCRDGQLSVIRVTPASRRADCILPPPAAGQ